MSDEAKSVIGMLNDIKARYLMVDKRMKRDASDADRWRLAVELHMFLLPAIRKLGEAMRLLDGSATPHDQYTISGGGSDTKQGDRITRKLRYLLAEYPAMKDRQAFKSGETERQYVSAKNDESAYLAELDNLCSYLVDQLNRVNPDSSGAKMLAELAGYESIQAWADGAGTKIAADGEYMRDWFLNTHKEA